jgi:hypothetical protein
LRRAGGWGKNQPSPVVESRPSAKETPFVRASPTVVAATATIVFLFTLGLLLVVSGFGVIRIVQQMIEAMGGLPQRWGENNLTLMFEIAAVLSMPVVLWSSVWFYRKAYAAEQRLQSGEG